MTKGSVDAIRPDSRSLLRRLLGEPMLHFILLGALVFLGYSVVSPAPPLEQDVIVVTAQDAEQLRAQYRSTWNRDPTSAELRDLLAQHVREEVLYREARNWGLDLNDQVVRVRMRQKMEFLLENPDAVPAPSEADLRTLFEATREKYVSPAALSFTQVFLGESGPDAAGAVLAALAGGADPATVGVPSLLPAGMELAQPGAVASAFGEGFFARIAALPPGVWTGPVRSAFGLHLLRVSEVRTTQPPRFEDVRGSVEAEWRRTESRKAADAAYAALRARYRIDLTQTGLAE
jgi:hypothetical protein